MERTLLGSASMRQRAAVLGMICVLTAACSDESDTGGTTTGGSGGVDGGGGSAGAPCAEVWTEDPDNPLIGFQDFGGVIWNDPWVLLEGGDYRMWATSGAGPQGVRIYELASSDGKSWTPVPATLTPVLSPGPDAHDAVATETPSVAKIGAQYHLFYTAVPDDGFTNYTIGHAVSADGSTWVKDAAPVVDKPSDAGAWGSLGVAEPGAAVKDGTLYLYYTMVRCRGGGAPPCTQTPLAERGIGLSTSTDGVSFTPHPNNPVLVQTSNYPASELYEGYSTPAALAADGKIHHFYDVAQVVDGGFRQVALAHAVSDDGVSFVETPDILVRDPSGWTAFEIRAPTVVDEGGSFSMWFAGNSGNDPSQPGFAIGIGRATSPKCRAR
jgi:predicted GH43/DUF377 family glycosyl hydrolase